MKKSDGARFAQKNRDPPFFDPKGVKYAQICFFLTFKENLVVSYLYFDWKLLEHIVVELSAKTACLTKIWFSRYGSKGLKRGFPDPKIFDFFLLLFFAN